MTIHRSALALAALAALGGCRGRRNVTVVSEGGPVAEAAADAGVDGVTDANADAPAEGEPGVVPTCIDSCNAALLVGCPNDSMNDCLLGCSDVLGQFPACAQPIDAANACTAKQPTSHWRCDFDGFAALDTSYCVITRSAMKSCLSTQYPSHK